MTDQLPDQLRDEFRQAMRRLATTVALITTGCGDNYGGMAATAVMSVTADPPTLVVAVNRTASMSPILDEHGWFCVNLLAEWHQHLIPIFSGGKTGKDRFVDGDWQLSETYPPILGDASASLVCQTASRMDVGTHTLFVGEVRAIANHPRINPLIWVDGRATSAATA